MPISEGLSYSALPTRRPDGVFLLPTRILLPGFALNTLFYAAIAHSAFSAYFWNNRRRRARLGLCPVCAYPMTGLDKNNACPECGVVSPSRVVES